LQKPTAFDVVAYKFLGDSQKQHSNCLDDFPKVKAMISAFEARPNIAKWLAEH